MPPTRRKKVARGISIRFTTNGKSRTEFYVFPTMKESSLILANFSHDSCRYSGACQKRETSFQVFVRAAAFRLLGARSYSLWLASSPLAYLLVRCVLDGFSSKRETARSLPVYPFYVHAMLNLSVLTTKKSLGTVARSLARATHWFPRYLTLVSADASINPGLRPVSRKSRILSRPKSHLENPLRLSS